MLGVQRLLLLLLLAGRGFCVAGVAGRRGM